MGEFCAYPEDDPYATLSPPGAIGQEGPTMGTHEDTLFTGQAQALALGPYFIKVFATMRTLGYAIFRSFDDANFAHDDPPIQIIRPSVVAISRLPSAAIMPSKTGGTVSLYWRDCWPVSLSYTRSSPPIRPSNEAIGSFSSRTSGGPATNRCSPARVMARIRIGTQSDHTGGALP